MALTLRFDEMTIDGQPYGCPECAATAFTLDGTGFINALPVWGNCSYSHGWEHPLVTVGDLKRIDAARSGREKATDADTFEIVIGGAVLVGVIHPEIVLDDLKVAGGAYWRRIAKPALRRRKNKAVRAVTQPVKKASRNAVASAKAAAIGAAWGLQAGGTDPDPDYTPEPVNPCPACSGKGRHKVESRVHGTTNVRCSVCLGTGEID